MPTSAAPRTWWREGVGGGCWYARGNCLPDIVAKLGRGGVAGKAGRLRWLLLLLLRQQQQQRRRWRRR